METQIFTTNDDVPSELTIEERTMVIEDDIASLSISESKSLEEAKRLETLETVLRSDRKKANYYSPVVLIPAGAGFVGAALVAINPIPAIVFMGCGLVSLIHSYNVIKNEYPKITPNKSSNIFKAFKELRRNRRDVLCKFLQEEKSVNDIREERESKYQELESLREYEKEVLSKAHAAKEEEVVEEEPLFVQVVEEARKERPQVKQIKL